MSVYSERDKSSSPVHQSVLGYVVSDSLMHSTDTDQWLQYLVTSTILYALMEVLFKKLASFKNDPASGYNGMRMVGLMGIHTLLWMWWVMPYKYYYTTNALYCPQATTHCTTLFKCRAIPMAQ